MIVCTNPKRIIVEVRRFPVYHLERHDAKTPDVYFGTVLLPVVVHVIESEREGHDGVVRICIKYILNIATMDVASGRLKALRHKVYIKRNVNNNID